MDLTESTTDEGEGTFHGVLGYRRESEWRKITALPSFDSDHTVWCEFCGAEAKPPLDFSKTLEPEDFCCTQYMELFRKMEQHWRLLQEHSGEASGEHDLNMELPDNADEVLKKSKRASSGNQKEMPGCRVTSSGLFTTIMFRLSEFLRLRKSKCFTARENDAREEMPRPSELCSSTHSFPSGFGVCRYKGPVKKFYSNGNKFLTVLEDGIAQVLYPSGNLAIITFIDDAEGVCIVLDDSKSSCPIRGFFQSSGIATCYHSNGNTCLHLDPWGGLCLNEDRSRSRKWKWTENTNNPTPFKPMYMSLNNNIGVRVRGRESVVVTFLASGQQARFSVGSCVKPSDPAPSLGKEELMAQVSQLNARLALERLRWCLTLSTDDSRRALKLPQVLVSQGRMLLKLSSSIWMEEKDRTYIQNCLQDCQ